MNNTHIKQFTEKKTQRFICIQQVLCRNTIRPWRFVQGQLLKKCCQGDKREEVLPRRQEVLPRRSAAKETKQWASFFTRMNPTAMITIYKKLCNICILLSWQSDSYIYFWSFLEMEGFMFFKSNLNIVFQNP